MSEPRDEHSAPPPLLLVDTYQSGEAVVVRASGEVDLHTAPELETAVAGALDRAGRHPCVIDLTNVTFLSSPGLNALVRAAQRAEREPGPLRIVVDANRPVIRPIELTGLDSILALYHTVDEALSPERDDQE